MKLNQISSINFKGNCDMHAHRGNWWIQLSENQVPQFQNVVRNRENQPFVMRNLTGDLFEIANRHITNPDDKIDKIIVSNLDCMTRNHPDMAQSSNFANGYTFLKNEYDGNIELLRNSTNPNEYLYATAQPGYGSAETLKKALEEGPKKFVGIKLHPKQLDIPANDKVYEPYMQLAQSKKLPCLFHCELNVDWSVPQGRLFADKSKWSTSDPRYIIELAQKYPDVPVILGHFGSGGAPAHQKTLELMMKALDDKKANLYADISWVDFKDGLPSDNPTNVLQFIKECKKRGQLNRVLFGTDIPVGEFSMEGAAQHNMSPSEIYKLTVDKLKNAIRNDNDLKADSENIIKKIFSQNAEDLFFGKKSVTPPKPKKMPKTKMGMIVGAGLILATGLVVAFGKNPLAKNSSSNTQTNVLDVSKS